ncbi:hypothetical protein LCGC14_1423360 [marine sediment metagenome]|uniref:Uncharacterized protein n=1 Tax=marine sediment metagenome TaxID=412755 RepID=A0A0F9JQI2_9ZZZZ
MASLGLTFQEMYLRVQKFLGTYGSSGATTDSAAETDSKDFVNKAYRRIINAYEWTFLIGATSLSTASGTLIYELPEGFRGLRTPFTFTDVVGYPPPTERTVDEIMEMQNYGVFTSWPQYYAIRAGQHTRELGQRFEVLFWPTPGAVYDMFYSYHVMPEKLENDADIPIGGPDFAECLQQMALGVAEEEKDELGGGPQMGAAQGQLTACITMDQNREPRSVGYDMPLRQLTAWEVARGTTRVNDVTYTVGD